jgi:hypothetical protein
MFAPTGIAFTRSTRDSASLALFRRMTGTTPKAYCRQE